MSYRKLFLLVITLSLTCAILPAEAYGPNSEEINDSLKFNEVYWLRPHNAYEKHTANSVQDLLEMGYYIIELDTYPNLDVKHNPDDVLSNFCDPSNTLPHCLESIKAWSDANPNHLPIQIQVDLKVREPLPITLWDDGNFRNLNAQISNVLGDKVFKPYDLHNTDIRDHVNKQGWPTLAELRGKVMVFMTGGKFLNKNNNQESYVNIFAGNPDDMKLDEMNLFVCPNVDDDYEHFEATNTAKDFNQSTSKWVVCGNSSGNTENDRIDRVALTAKNNGQLLNLWVSGDNNAKYQNEGFMYTAVGWGASWISQDNFPSSFENRWDSSVDIPGHQRVKAGKRASVPIAFEIKSVNTGKCLDVKSASYSEGTPIQSWDCNDTPAQTWIYTTERQLRPMGDQKYCLDIDGGQALRGSVNHLWDCDGGPSEKWNFNNSGQFISADNNSGYAIDNNYGGNNTEAHMWDQEPNNDNQLFIPLPKNATIKWDRW